jgi:hypothetical protein
LESPCAASFNPLQGCQFCYFSPLVSPAAIHIEALQAYGGNTIEEVTSKRDMKTMTPLPGQLHSKLLSDEKLPLTINPKILK